MDLIEFNTRSFIVKVWLEEANEATGRTRWRGHITHVADGERRYVEDFEDITDFIKRNLEDMGVKFVAGGRGTRWLHRFGLHFTRKS